MRFDAFLKENDYKAVEAIRKYNSPFPRCIFVTFCTWRSKRRRPSKSASRRSRG